MVYAQVRWPDNTKPLYVRADSLDRFYESTTFDGRPCVCAKLPDGKEVVVVRPLIGGQNKLEDLSQLEISWPATENHNPNLCLAVVIVLEDDNLNTVELREMRQPLTHISMGGCGISLDYNENFSDGIAAIYDRSTGIYYQNSVSTLGENEFIKSLMNIYPENRKVNYWLVENGLKLIRQSEVGE